MTIFTAWCIQVYGVAALLRMTEVAWAIGIFLGGTFVALVVGCSLRCQRAVAINSHPWFVASYLAAGAGACGVACYVDVVAFPIWLTVFGCGVTVFGFFGSVFVGLERAVGQRKCANGQDHAGDVEMDMSELELADTSQGVR